MGERNSIEDIWGQRSPYEGEGHWRARSDVHVEQSPDHWIQSCCMLCSNGCALDIGVKNGRIVGVRGREVDRVNRGRLGPKGLHGWQANHSGDRLTRPLIKDGKGFRESSWDEAMSLIVARCRDTIQTRSPGAVGIYNSGQLFLEEYYTLSMVAHAGIGTDQLDGNTRLCTATASQALRETFGSDGQPCSYADIDVTDCLLIVGSNMAETQTVLWMRVLDRLAGPRPPKIIVVDPRMTPTAAAADLHLTPRLGTNVALLNGLLHLLLKDASADRAFIDEHTQGIERLEATILNYSPERVRQITGVPESQLHEAARILAAAPTLVSVVLQGVYQSNQATAAACQVNNINLVLGKIGRPGSGILQMNGQPTAQNTRETGCDGEFPFFLNYQNSEHIHRWAELWNVDPLSLPHWHEHSHAMEIFRHAELGSIGFLWVIATNPAISMPELHRVRKILRQERLFLVVQDAFMTETARLADVVLPVALWGEKIGTFTNADRTVHISYKAIEPPGEARSDFDIFLDFARRMDFRDKDGQPLIKWSDPEGAFNHWARCSKGWLVDYSSMTYEKLSRGSGIPWPCNDRWPDGCERIYTDLLFHTAADVTQAFGHDLEIGAPRTPAEYSQNDPKGRALLKAANYIPPLEEPDEEYPLYLTTGRVVYQFHTRTKTGRSPQLQQAAPDVFVQLSEADAKRFQIAEGDEVDVSSRRGSLRGRAKVGGIEPGHIFIPFHYGYWDRDGEDHHRAANELTITGWDPVSKQPFYKYAAVSIRKAGTLVRSVASGIVETASKVKDRAMEMADLILSGTHATPRSHVSDSIGQLREALRQFADACRFLKGVHFEEPEMIGVWETMARWCGDLFEQFRPFAEHYDEHPDKESKSLRETLFPAARPGAFGLLRDLQSLAVLGAALRGANVVLQQASQGLRDAMLMDATLRSDQQIRRCQAWVENEVKHRTVHTLIVPS